MNQQIISFQRSKIEEAKTLVEIYNSSFYADYVMFGSCPGYGKTVGEMILSIQKNIKYTIYANEKAVGVISISQEPDKVYHIGCLCVIPEYQGKGIGTKAIQFAKDELSDWKEITLDTPADKIENVKFYTEKCGFKIVRESYDGSVRLFDFKLTR